MCRHLVPSSRSAWLGGVLDGHPADFDFLLGGPAEG